MCGRFTRDFTWQQVREFSRMLDLVLPAEDPAPAWNIAPTDPHPVIVSTGIANECLALLRRAAERGLQQPVDAHPTLVAHDVDLARSAGKRRNPQVRR